MPPPRRRRRPASTVGSAPLTLPLVATVAVTAIQPTSASVIGSINPQGRSGSWWFVYGTTPAFGQSTGPQSLAATSIPQTESATLSDLATGSEYWVAMVGQTAAGTVVSAPVTFTPQLPAATPTAPAGAPPVSIPHFSWPFTITSEGAQVVEQGSLEEIVSCVQTVLACPVGTCPELPTFGYPDPVFLQAPPNADAIVAAVQLWEPRADEDAVVQALDSGGADWSIALNTQATGTGQ